MDYGFPYTWLMDPISEVIETVQRALAKDGAAVELARRAGVPYTTIRDMERAGWSPRSVANLQRLHRAALDWLAEDAGERAA